MWYAGLSHRRCLLALYKTGHQLLTLVSGTAGEVLLPEGSTEHLFCLADPAIPYAYGPNEATVNAGNGYPMPAGSHTTVDEAVKKHSLYFRQTSGGPVVLHWTYLYSVVR